MAFKRTKYRAPDPAKLKERGSRSGNRFDSIFINGVTPFKPAAGTNILRIIKDPDADYYGEPIWVHSYVGIKNSTYLCPKKMGKSKNCPICDMADDAARAGDKDERYQLEAKERVLAYVIDRQDEKSGLKVWDMSWTMDRDVADACVIKKTGKAIDITHPDAGYDISFVRQGTTKNNTKYLSMQVDRDSTPLSEDQRQADAWIDEVQERPLLSLLKYRDQEYLQDIISGKIEEKDEDDGEEESTERDERRAPSRATRGRSDREEEVEEREDDDEDEAPPPRDRGRNARDRQEEQPVRGSGRRASADEQDTDADEDEEDNRRVTRRGRDSEGETEDEPRQATRRVSRAQLDEPDDDTDDTDDREPPPRRQTSARGRQEERSVRKGSKRGEPEDNDDADADDVDDRDPPPRRASRQREEAEEEQDHEAEEAGRWARNKREDDDDRPARRTPRESPPTQSRGARGARR